MRIRLAPEDEYCVVPVRAMLHISKHEADLAAMDASSRKAMSLQLATQFAKQILDDGLYEKVDTEYSLERDEEVYTFEIKVLKRQ